jgi:hypothetical protein
VESLNTVLQNEGVESYQDQTGEVILRGCGICIYRNEHDSKCLHSLVFSESFPEQAVDIYNLVNQGYPVYIEGSKGCGKTTTMFYLRQILRSSGLDYVAIDAHFTRVPVEITLAAINYATQCNMIILVDSADRMIVTKRNIRGISVENHIHRSEGIIRSLDGFVANGGRLILTVHDEVWRNQKTNLNCKPWTGLVVEWNQLMNLWNSLVEKMPPFHLRRAFDIQFQDNEGLMSAMIELGMPTEVAFSVSTLLSNPDFMYYLDRFPIIRKTLPSIFLSRRFAKVIAEGLNDVGVDSPQKDGGEISTPVLWDAVVELSRAMIEP